MKVLQVFHFNYSEHVTIWSVFRTKHSPWLYAICMRNGCSEVDVNLTYSVPPRRLQILCSGCLNHRSPSNLSLSSIKIIQRLQTQLQKLSN